MIPRSMNNAIERTTIQERTGLKKMVSTGTPEPTKSTAGTDSIDTDAHYPNSDGSTHLKLCKQTPANTA